MFERKKPNEKKPLYLPTPEMIAQEAEAIRKGWTEVEKNRAATISVSSKREFTVPTGRVIR